MSRLELYYQALDTLEKLGYISEDDSFETVEAILEDLGNEDDQDLL